MRAQFSELSIDLLIWQVECQLHILSWTHGAAVHIGGNVINPDRSEKKLIGQGHKRQNLWYIALVGSTICISIGIAVIEIGVKGRFQF